MCVAWSPIPAQTLGHEDVPVVPTVLSEARQVGKVAEKAVQASMAEPSAHERDRQ